jgi:hypothetical protein
MSPSFRGKFIPSNTEDGNQNNTKEQITVVENASALIRTLLHSINVCEHRETHYKDIENFMKGDRILEVAKKFLEGELKNE